MAATVPFVHLSPAIGLTTLDPFAENRFHGSRPGRIHFHPFFPGDPLLSLRWAEKVLSVPADELTSLSGGIYVFELEWTRAVYFRDPSDTFTWETDTAGRMHMKALRTWELFECALDFRPNTTLSVQEYRLLEGSFIPIISRRVRRQSALSLSPR